MEIQRYIDALSTVLGQEVRKNEHGLHAFILDNVPVMLHLHFHQQYIITPNGDHHCSEFEMEHKRA